MSSKTKISIDRVKELLQYEAETGNLIWKEDIFCGRGKGRPVVRKGDIAGYLNPQGYLEVGIDSYIYKGHTLSFVINHGRWPVARLDHRDQNKSNNRIDNLREVTATENSQNCHQPNETPKRTSSSRGVYWDKSTGFWRAKITANKKTLYLGSFRSEEEAAKVYVEAKNKLHIPRFPDA